MITLIVIAVAFLVYIGIYLGLLFLVKKWLLQEPIEPEVKQLIQSTPVVSIISLSLMGLSLLILLGIGWFLIRFGVA